DLAMLHQRLGIMPFPVYCTKIASRIARTYTDKHGLKDLVRELLGLDLSKQQQLSDWGAEALSDAQLAYAASDVLHLHALKERLDAILLREGRAELAAACFRFLPDRVRLPPPRPGGGGSFCPFSGRATPGTAWIGNLSMLSPSMSKGFLPAPAPDSCPAMPRRGHISARAWGRKRLPSRMGPSDSLGRRTGLGMHSLTAASDVDER